MIYVHVYLCPFNIFVEYIYFLRTVFGYWNYSHMKQKEYTEKFPLACSVYFYIVCKFIKFYIGFYRIRTLTYYVQT